MVIKMEKNSPLVIRIFYFRTLAFGISTVWGIFVKFIPAIYGNKEG